MSITLYVYCWYMETTNNYGGIIDKNKKTYDKPICKVLGWVSKRIKEEFENVGIDWVLSKLDNFSENDYCGFVYYILSLNEDNKNISKYITNYFVKLKNMGIRKKLSKDVYLRIYKKLNEDKNSNGNINILLMTSLNLFNELDDEIVNIIIKYSKAWPNFILYYIDSFRKINVKKVLKIFFEFLKRYGVNKKKRKDARKEIIKNLLKAWYEENVYENLKEFWISDEDFDHIAEEIWKETFKLLQRYNQEFSKILSKS